MASLLVRHPAVARSIPAAARRRCSRRLLSEQPLLNNIMLRGADGRLVTATVEGSRPPSRRRLRSSSRCSRAAARPSASSKSGRLPAGRRSCSAYPVPGAPVHGRGRRCSRHQPQPAAARAAVCQRVAAGRIDRHAGRSERTRDGAQPGQREVHRRARSVRRASRRTCRAPFCRRKWTVSSGFTATPSSIAARGC